MEDTKASQGLADLVQTGLADLDRNFARLDLFTLVQRDRQNAVAKRGGDLVLIHRTRNREAPRKAAIPAFTQMIAPLLVVRRRLLLARNGQDTVFERDIEVILRQAGQLHFNVHVVLILVRIDTESCALTLRRVAKHATDQPVKITMQPFSQFHACGPGPGVGRLAFQLSAHQPFYGSSYAVGTPLLEGRTQCYRDRGPAGFRKGPVY